MSLNAITVDNVEQEIAYLKMQSAAATGASQILPGLVRALDAAETAEGIDGSIRVDLRAQVRDLKAIVSNVLKEYEQYV